MDIQLLKTKIMKKTTYIKWASLLACACISATSSVNAATTILIDYDGTADSLGAHNAEVNKGGFTGLTSTNYAPWESIGTLAVQLSSNLAFSGGGVNYAANNNGGTRIIAIDTGHTIASGDSFNLGFKWRDAYQWRNIDTVSLNLYYTNDDTVGGTATDIAVLDSGSRTNTGAWEDESATGLTFNDATADGKKLFLKIVAHSTGNRYARVDNVFLDVTSAPVPEPSSAALLGLGGIALILRRRK